jgi:hypothetical protein
MQEISHNATSSHRFVACRVWVGCAYQRHLEIEVCLACFTISFLLLLAIIAIHTTFIMTSNMKSRVLSHSRTRAAVHDDQNSPATTQIKKPMKLEAESRTPFEKEQVEPVPVFRRIPSLTSVDFDDILSLKIANPVCDSDEADFRFVRRKQREERDRVKELVV